MRAKFIVTAVKRLATVTSVLNAATSLVEDQIEPSKDFETLSMVPVCPQKFGPNGEHEDNDFHRWSPSGSFELTITNPALIGKFKPGEKYYLDFTKAI